MRKPFSLAAVTCLLVLPLAACDDQPDAVRKPSPTAMSTVAPGRLAVAVGTGKDWGWDGESLGEAADLYFPGPMAQLPSGDVLLTTNSQIQLISLGRNGALKTVSNQKDNGMSGFGKTMLALAVRGDTIAVLATGDALDANLSTVPVAGGEGRFVGKGSAKVAPGADPLLAGTSIAPVGGGWLVQIADQVHIFDSAGKREPVRLPVTPKALTADGDELLVATADSVVRLRGMKIVERMSLALSPGAVPSALTPDGRGGAFVATRGEASIVHTSPGKPSKALAMADESDHGECGAEVPGDPMKAPFRNIGGVSLRGKTLFISSTDCHRIYQLGL